MLPLLYVVLIVWMLGKFASKWKEGNEPHAKKNILIAGCFQFWRPLDPEVAKLALYYFSGAWHMYAVPIWRILVEKSVRFFLEIGWCPIVSITVKCKTYIIHPGQYTTSYVILEPRNEFLGQWSGSHKVECPARIQTMYFPNEQLSFIKKKGYII